MSPFDRRVHFAVAAAAIRLSVALAGCSSGDATDAKSDASSSASDASTDDASSAADATIDDASDAGGEASPHGDRNLGLIEPYPDSVLIQEGGRFYNVMDPPKNWKDPALDGGAPVAAYGDGVHDDTEAFRDALDFMAQALKEATLPYDDAGQVIPPHPDQDGGKVKDNVKTPGQTAGDSYWIYIPDGTYLVSHTLLYHGPGLSPWITDLYKTQFDAGPPLSGQYDLTRLRIVGQSREKTKIVLAPGTFGADTWFNDASAGHVPNPVFAFQSPDTPYNQGNANSLMKNLTIEIGAGNPNAVGILAQGANAISISNVLVTSDDGQGKAGLWMPIATLGGCFHDLTVSGFDYGILQQPTAYQMNINVGVNGCFENVTLEKQNVAGIFVAYSTFTARNLKVDESASSPATPALLVGKDAPQVVLVDSLLEGSANATTSAIAVEKDADPSKPPVVFVRSVTTTNYPAAVSIGDAAVSGTTVSEYSSGGTVTLFDSGTTSLNLPVEQIPLATWYDPDGGWANVEDYRPVGAPEAGVDRDADTAAAIGALNSGKPVVYFPKAKYLTSPLDIPPWVQRVDCMYTDFPAGDAGLTGEFRAVGDAGAPLFLEYCQGINSQLVLEGNRDIVQRDGNDILTKNNAPTKIFVDNGGGGSVTSNSQVWARGIDIEWGNPDFSVNGGTMWIMGCHDEDTGTVLHATNGASAEILGGYNIAYPNTPVASGLPMFINDNSNVSVIYSETTCCGGYSFPIIVSEMQGGDAGQIRTIGPDSAGKPPIPPFVPFPDGNGQDFIIPLYVGRIVPN